MRAVGHILEEMTTSTPRRRHFAASPFKADPEPVIEQFESGDMVSHDSFGLGRVVNKETAAVTVDFGPRLVRIASPFPKLAKL